MGLALIYRPQVVEGWIENHGFERILWAYPDPLSMVLTRSAHISKIHSKNRASRSTRADCMFRALTTLVGKPPPALTTLVGKPPPALIPLVNHVDLISHRESCSSANEFFCPSEGGFFLYNRCPLKCEVRRHVWWPKYFIDQLLLLLMRKRKRRMMKCSCNQSLYKRCPLADWYIYSEMTTKHSCQKYIADPCWTPLTRSWPRGIQMWIHDKMNHDKRSHQTYNVDLWQGDDHSHDQVHCGSMMLMYTSVRDT